MVQFALTVDRNLHYLINSLIFNFLLYIFDLDYLKKFMIFSFRIWSPNNKYIKIFLRFQKQEYFHIFIANIDIYHILKNVLLKFLYKYYVLQEKNQFDYIFRLDINN